MSERADIDECAPDCEAVVVDRDAIDRALAQLPTGDTLYALEGIFAALSDRTRLRILSALTLGPLCVCDLAQVADVSQSAVSHQLRILRVLDLVRFERDGRRAIYRLADEHVRTLFAQGLEHVRERGSER
jgi:DNA-binding transcriptional ArsR family regulator